MGFLIAGTVIFFITAVVVVMGVPYLYFLRLDHEWEAAQAAAADQPKVSAEVIEHPKVKHVVERAVA